MISNASRPLAATNHDVTPPRVRFSNPCSTMFAPNSSPVSGSYHQSSVAKGNLTFYGTTGVNQFLERVSELTSNRHVSEEQLFNQAVDLFSGDALTWAVARFQGSNVVPHQGSRLRLVSKDEVVLITKFLKGRNLLTDSLPYPIAKVCLNNINLASLRRRSERDIQVGKNKKDDPK